jgi:hypothetical protein
MPRTISQASRNYAAGTYGPFSVNNFTKNDTERLTLTLSVENWPDVPEAVRATIMFFDPNHKVVTYAPDPVTGELVPTTTTVRVQVGGGIFTWPGRPIGWDGSVLTRVDAQVQVPRVGDAKATVAEGEVTLEALVSIRTAVTVAAI